MKIFAGVLLALSIGLPACSAENEPSNAPVAAANATASTPAASDRAMTDPKPESTMAAADAPKPTKRVSAPAARTDIVEGRHYRVLTPAQGTSSPPDKVEVAEVFMYSCPHCYSFEPFITSYVEQKPSYVSFVRVPASFNAVARTHAKAYYAAESLGVLEDVHTDFFREFHQRRNRLASDDAILSFLADQGVDREQAKQALTSFAVDTKLRQADTLVRRYRIDSVPALVINGKYVTSGSMAGNMDKLREVVDYLVAKEAAAQ